MQDGFYLEKTYANTVAQEFYETCDGLDYGFLNCDCGNTATGCTGCSFCNVVTGYRCQTGDAPADMSTCTEVCGDSINYEQGTKCDDGNLRNNDGCSNTCTIETGYKCRFTTTTTKDTCYEICGDNYDFGTYACDDGNSVDYDGCSASCTIYDGWYCFGGSKTTTDSCYEHCGDGRNYKS